jgi:ribosomal-protein-alanine N-acetyltransferase
MIDQLMTDRLQLRRWQNRDRARYAEMNADPIVMRYEPAMLTRSRSDAQADEIDSLLSERGGLGMFASELRETNEVIGFTAVIAVDFDAHFAPATEIGWRLIPSAWRQGYATEAARALAKCSFEVLRLPEIVAFSVAGNARSRAVMRCLGMTHELADDFEHPEIAVGSPLRRHVLYRLKAENLR